MSDIKNQGMLFKHEDLDELKRNAKQCTQEEFDELMKDVVFEGQDLTPAELRLINEGNADLGDIIRIRGQRRIQERRKST